MNSRIINYLKSFYSLGFLFIPAVSFASPILEYCGGDYDYASTYYAIVDQRQLIDQQFDAFLHCPDESLCYGDSQDHTINIEEWKDFLDADLNREQVNELIYNKDLTWYEGLKSGVVESTLPLKLTKQKLQDFLNYMILAKIAESSVSDKYGGSGWYQGEDQKTVDNAIILKTAQKLMSSTPSDFIRRRLVFQAIRAAHYLQKNDEAIALFDRYLDRTDEDYIYYRAIEQTAGAFYNLKKYNKAAQGFLIAFKNLPERKYINAVNLKFTFQNLKGFESGMIPSQWEQEYYFYSSLFHNQDVEKTMRKLMALDVNSPYLDVLMARSIDKFQAVIFTDGSFSYFYEALTPTQISGLKNVATTISTDKNRKQNDVPQLMLGLLEMTQDKNEQALTYFAKINNQSPYRLTAYRLEFIARTRLLRQLDSKRINELYLELEKSVALHDNTPTATAFFNDIAKLYDQSGDKIGASITAVDYYGHQGNRENDWAQIQKAKRYNYDWNLKYPLMDELTIDEFRTHFLNKKQLTDFEKLVLARINGSAQDLTHDLMGNVYMTQGKLDDALAEYKQVKKPSDYWNDSVRPELFSSSIKEWMDVDFSSISDQMHLKYPSIVGKELEADNLEYYIDNKIDLIQIMKSLEKGAQSKKKIVDYNYMLGNAWYNLSVEGWFVNTLYYIDNNNRNVIKPDYWDPKPLEAKYQQVFYRASDYYKKALDGKGEKETKAKVTFALAKANRCFTSEYDRSKRSDQLELCGDHVTYFDQLSADYSDTQYYQEVLRECSWFVAR